MRFISVRFIEELKELEKSKREDFSGKTEERVKLVEEEKDKGLLQRWHGAVVRHKCHLE